MSKIEELIQQYCPDGVEFKELGEVISALRTGLNPRQNFKLNVPNATHFYITVRELNGFNIKVSDKTDRVDEIGLSLIQNRSKINKGDILFSGTGTIGRTALVSEVPSNWNVKEGIYVITPIFQLINERYLIYLIHSNQTRNQILAKSEGSTVSSISMASLQKIQIPIPPLPVQEEIVRILDSFTELEAELEARKKQYEYYRNKLLTPQMVDGKWMMNGEEVEWKPINSVCTKISSINWRANSDKDFKYIDLTSVNRDTNKIDHNQIINSNNAPSRAKQIVYTDDIIFGTTRPTLKRYSIIPLEYNDQICSTGFCVFRVKSNILIPKYLFFCLTLSRFNEYVDKNQEGASYPSISDSKVKLFTIPIISLSKQECIVSILDKFDSLVNDISVGLPSEIEARRRQYEYYRNKLLTFKRIDN